MPRPPRDVPDTLTGTTAQQLAALLRLVKSLDARVTRLETESDGVIDATATRRTEAADLRRRLAEVLG